jgi:type I restriction enzyme S subunit
MKINKFPNIPSDWEIKQIRHIFQIHNGSTPKSGNPEYWNGDIDWITPEDLGSNMGKSIASSRRKITELGYESCGVSLARISHEGIKESG